MTARYRAEAPLYIKRLIVPPEEFESDLPPGRHWHPLNDEAKAACAKRDSERGAVNAIAAKLDPTPATSAAVEIPADWASASASKRRAIAMRLGAPRNATAENADSFIEAELERRAQKAAA